MANCAAASSTHTHDSDYNNIVIIIALFSEVCDASVTITTETLMLEHWADGTQRRQGSR